MASKRIGLIAGGIIAGGLLLGTAGLVAAQDPTASPSAGPTTSGSAGMMGGSGTMGSGSAGMMGGSGMMGSGSAGMMGGSGMGQMDADDIAAMTALHQSMAANGTCDPAQMTQLHAQMHSSR
ncbi:MAG: hypothetical protein HY264_07255 [Chloroflexi bacterium]|nr:hypothetical protein [Chloroflexota bacterium]